MSVTFFFSPVPNKAHQGKTWVNDKRHTWKQWKYGHSSLAVDGKENTNLPNCAIMDNHYVDKPVFMVDLGRATKVNGAVVLTWQGSGQGKSFLVIPDSSQLSFVIVCQRWHNHFIDSLLCLS